MSAKCKVCGDPVDEDGQCTYFSQDFGRRPVRSRLAKASNGRCVARGISTMRLALGYRKPLPVPLDHIPDGSQMPRLMGKCFPKHNILFFGGTHGVGIAPRNVRHCGTSTNGYDPDKYLWCFSYQVTENASHFVIGPPSSAGVSIYQIYAIEL